MQSYPCYLIKSLLVREYVQATHDMLFFSEEKIPDLDIQIESKDILYNLPNVAIHQLR